MKILLYLDHKESRDFYSTLEEIFNFEKKTNISGLYNQNI